MIGLIVHFLWLQDTTVLHAVSIATALLAGCSPVTGDYESSLILPPLSSILLQCSGRRLRGLSVPPFCDWVTVVNPSNRP